MDTRFHCVYLLTSLDPLCKGDYYIGYTVNPLRRLRQHNGELVNGARRTKRRGRPWTLVCCVSGFTQDYTALKFEWCWQHPQESARLKHTLPTFLHHLHKLPYAIGVLHLLLRARLFVRLELTLHILESGIFQEMAAIAFAHRPPAVGQPALDHLNGSSPSSSRAADHTLGLEPGDESGTLPALVPSALLHIEEITLDAFQAKYLSSESAIVPLESPATDPLHLHADTNSLLPCPYDLTALSQAVQEEWEAEDTSHGGGDGFVSNTHTGTLWENEHNTTRTGSSPPPLSCWSSQDVGSSLQESTSCAKRSCPRVYGGPHNTTPLRSPSSRALSPSASPPRGCAAAGASEYVAMRDCLRGRNEKTPRRIPLRFRHYTEVDFARDYEQELELLGCGMLVCTFCALPLRAPYVMRCVRAPFCSLMTHIVCLAMWMQHDMFSSSDVAAHETASFSKADTGAPSDVTSSVGEGIGCCFPQKASPSWGDKMTLVPTQPYPCPLCGELLHWASLVKNLKQRAVADQRARSHHRQVVVEKRLQTRLARAHHVSQKRRRAAATPTGETGAICSKVGYHRAGRRGLSAGASRGISQSPPSLTFQAHGTVQRCSSLTNPVVLHRPSESNRQKQHSQEFSDVSEKWMANEHTLRVMEFDEDEWLNY